MPQPPLHQLLAHRWPPPQPILSALPLPPLLEGTANDDFGTGRNSRVTFTSPGGELFIAMELIAGVTARAWLHQRERTTREILAVYTAAGRGLAAAHQAGLVHRDFKPDNVMIGRDGRARFSVLGELDWTGLEARAWIAAVL